MASTFKRLFSGYGSPNLPTLAYTVPPSTSTILREIQVTNPGFVGLGSVPLPNISAISQGASGTIYYYARGAVFKLSPTGQISLIAGGPNQTGDVQATGRAARFGTATYNHTSCIVDPTETYLYLLDQTNNRILRITISTGVVTSIFTAANLPVSGNFTDTKQIALSPDGSKLILVYVASSGYKLCQVNTASPYTATDVPTYAISSGTGVVVYGATYNADGTKAYVSRQTTNSGNPRCIIDEVTLATGASTNVQTTHITSAAYVDGSTNSVVSGPFYSFVHIASNNGPMIVGSTYSVPSVRSLLWPVTTASDFYMMTVVGKQNFGSSAVGESGLVAGYPGTSRLRNASNDACVVAKSYDGNNVIIGCNGAIMVHSLLTGYTSILAGSSVVVTSVIEGDTPYLTDGSFNLYIVPNGETLDVAKHRRFSNESVPLSSTWFGEIRKNLNAGDKVYFEPTSFNLTLELSGLEVT